MSRRLAKGGRLIDRNRSVRFTFDGKPLMGFAGDTLAAALLANDQVMMGRSFKYHRPRGAVAYGAEEPNALVNLGLEGRFEPNQRATTQDIFNGLTATSQNRWPSLAFDVGAVNQLLAKFLPAGFYYKMFIHPKPFWKHVYEPFIRRAAGLGKAPRHADADIYEHMHAHLDHLVVGGGIAGLLAARDLARGGASVMVVEQAATWGGRAVVDGMTVEGQAAEDWVAATVAELSANANVTLRLRCMASGVYDHGYVLAYERLTDHLEDKSGPRHRLWRLRVGEVVLASGAIERPLSFAGNDIPGVMLASAMRDYLVNHAISPGDRTVVVTNNDDAYRTALALVQAGLKVPAIIDARPAPAGALINQAREAGIRIMAGHGVVEVKGGARVTGVAVGLQEGEGAILEEIACEAVAMSGGWSPAVHLWSHCGGKLAWDAEQAMFRPDHARPPTGDAGQATVRPVGAADGNLTHGAVLRAAGLTASGPEEGAPAPVWIMPAGAKPALREKMWLDFQNDVKVSDLQLAAREGYVSVEHAKRYTTLGMATDQGKLSNINGLAVLSEALSVGIPEVGTTTFRPPYTPISMGAIAGSARGDLFQPLRRTPIHDWHVAQGAHMEPVGLWQRPYAFPRAGEALHDAVNREVLAVRERAGVLDASTLGKIIVSGPDAGRFLDMLYTNMMSNLPVGKCRYGLMCSEQGFLMDDGVVARLDDQTWLCHTTTGGADRIHAHMEDWLQCEWWDWQVYTANVTEQYGQIGIAGPKARDILRALGGGELAELPFMHWADGQLAGIDARVYHISFSGEESFEIAVPASHTRALWDAVMTVGAEWDVMPYGTEALHVLRAEKGFIMIGDETDGTVIPQDLNLDWAISKKKDDFIGKRGQARSHMQDPARWKLVGLETLDGSVLPDGAYAVAEGSNPNGQRNTQGRVTSSYYSPTLKRGIAMGLVAQGPARMGEVIDFPTPKGTIRARICDPVFYKKEQAHV